MYSNVRSETEYIGVTRDLSSKSNKEKAWRAHIATDFWLASGMNVNLQTLFARHHIFSIHVREI